MTADGLMDVHLLGLPVDAQRIADEHYDALVREFDLIRQSGEATETVPARLLALIDELSTRFDQFGEQPRALLEAARERGSSSVDLVYRVPREAAEACRQLLELLDEADSYCVAGEHLVTLASPPVVRAYREWFLREFIEQSQGRAPRPWSELAVGDRNDRSASAHASATEPPASAESPAGEEDQWPTAISGESATVVLSGELDLALAPSLRDHLNRLHTEGVRHFTLDTSAVAFIDSVGLSVLLALYRRCREEDGSVSLIRPSAVIRRTLEISGLLEVLNVS